jgi:hypothetical protein
MRMIGPVAMDQPAVVVRSCVVVGVCVNEGCPYSGSLKSRRQGNGECLPNHHVTLFVSIGTPSRGPACRLRTDWYRG